MGLRWLVASRVSRPGSIEYRSVYKPARAKEHHLRLLAVSAANDRPSALERARASAPLPRGGSANGQTGLHARPSLPSSFSLSLSLSLPFSLFLPSFAEKGFLQTIPPLSLFLSSSLLLLYPRAAGPRSEVPPDSPSKLLLMDHSRCAYMYVYVYMYVYTYIAAVNRSTSLSAGRNPYNAPLLAFPN